MSVGHSLTVLLLFSAFVVYQVIKVTRPPEIPKIDEDTWWGIGGRREDDVRIKPFKISASEEVIMDLKWRLKNRRPVRPSIEGAANRYGTNSEFLEDFLDYWLNVYNWTEQQTFLNKYPHFRTEIQGLHLHFIHVKPDNPKNKKVLPLLMVHGWPGSVREFYDVIELMRHRNDKEYVVELVVPSLPGFGFSDATTKPGLGLIQAAVLFKKLMNRLGHQQFYMQGGDLGALTLQILAVYYPKSVLGFHTNFPVVYTVRSYLLYILGSFYPPWFVKPEQYHHLYPVKDRALFIYQESGYFHLQTTKPDSIGAAMDDSPVGLAAYMAEKFITGTNMSWIDKFNLNELREKLNYTTLIDNFMVYWTSESCKTAFRLYYESFDRLMMNEAFNALSISLTPPIAIYRSSNDLFTADNFLKELFSLILHLEDHNTGHFPAMEQPEEFTEDVLTSIDKFEGNSIAKNSEVAM